MGKKLFNKLYLWLLYTIILIKEVIIANFLVAKIVLNYKEKTDSCIITYKTSLKSDLYKTIFANSITLTPGTITVDLKENIYKIHCLKKEFADGVYDSKFEKILLKLEEI